MPSEQVSLPQLEANLAAARAGNDDIALADALYHIAWELRSDDVHRAADLAAEAREVSIRAGYKLGQARGNRVMAMTIRDYDELPRLLRLAEEAKVLFDEVGDPSGRAGSRDFLSSVYEHLGELNLALELALDAVTIARGLEDPIRLGFALSSAGGVLAASGRVDAGLEHLHEALRLFEGIGHVDGTAVICTRLCKVLGKAGKSEEALFYAQRCRDIAIASDNEWSHAAALSVMGDLEKERGQYAAAAELYRKSISLLTTETARNLLGAGVRISLGRMLMETGELDTAAAELEDALAAIEGDTVSVVAEASAHEALAELREKQSLFAAALAHLRKGQKLRAQIAEKDARNRITQLETRAAIEAAKKDAEIHKLRFVELHGMQSQLLAAEKMALTGTLAAGAAHELNNPLGVLRSNLEISSTASKRLLVLLESDPNLGPQVKRLVGALESVQSSSELAIARLAEVADNFKRFTELDRAEIRSFDVREGLNSAIDLLEPTISRSIRIERTFGDVPRIDGWPRELNQAFLTVLRNAAEAIDGEGTISVETAVGAGRVFVHIRDDGRGMNKEKAAHLFDIAWSEEGARTKMRMGLSAAWAATRKHGGEIAVESAPGRGTTVSFSFPRAAG